MRRRQMVSRRWAGGVKMELTWSSDQEDFRTSVRTFLESRSSVDKARALSEGDDGFDRQVWAQMAAQLGLQSMAIPEQLGGAGFGLAEQLIVQEELGRVLYAGPFLSTIISTAALLHSDGEARNALLPDIADGTAVVVLAEAEDRAFFATVGLRTHADVDGGTAAVTGVKTWVLDAEIATTFLVTAQSSDGIVVVAVDRDADGVAVDVASSLDRTRPLARVTFDHAQGRVVADASAGADVVEHARDVAVAALAAEQLGLAERCLELAVDYTRVREQFGRPVGSFQSLKHRAADLLTGVEAARSAVIYAAWAATDEPAELPIAATVAGVQSSTISVQAAQENLQMHGGIGFTWEHDAHLYLRRAKSSHVLYGSPTDHRGRLADLVSL
ncbi:MAG: acyl-CoA dehydrogenase family protein [Ilumatobacteraceae bacterium]